MCGEYPPKEWAAGRARSREVVVYSPVLLRQKLRLRQAREHFPLQHPVGLHPTKLGTPTMKRRFAMSCSGLCRLFFMKVLSAITGR